MRKWLALFLSVLMMTIPGHGFAEDQETTDTASLNTPTRVQERTLAAYIVQTRQVKTSCFTPELKRLLAALKTKLGGNQIMVTSGFRGTNRARRGSFHRRCMAADVQIQGVSPRQVAAAARSLAGIGGVGTYCHTRSVHVDVGPRRDWFWPCRKRRR